MKANLRFCDIKDPLPERILNKMRKAAFEDVTLYPQNYGKLVSRLARKLKVKQENIVLVNGVDEGIELMSRAFGKDILIFPPTYYELKDAPERNGLKLTEKYSFDGKAYRVRATGRDLKNRSLVFLCNPNMPFGLLTRKEIGSIASRTRGVVAVDETYMDFTGETSLPLLRKRKNLLILRSFSKGYSLAGLRIGYIIGSKRLIDRIKAIKMVCNVTSVSVNSAMVVLGEEKYFNGLRKDIISRKDRFETLLKERGFRVLDTETNVVLVKFPSAGKASSFVRFLESKGIAVNQGNGLSTCGLDRSFVRFACGTEAQMRHVSNVIRKRYRVVR